MSFLNLRLIPDTDAPNQASCLALHYADFVVSTVEGPSEQLQPARNRQAYIPCWRRVQEVVVSCTSPATVLLVSMSAALASKMILPSSDMAN
jgi:hypothetical protein